LQNKDRKLEKDDKNTVVDTYKDKMPEGDNYYGLENVINCAKFDYFCLAFSNNVLR